jgi:hypothetical protein
LPFCTSFDYGLFTARFGLTQMFSPLVSDLKSARQKWLDYFTTFRIATRLERPLPGRDFHPLD